MNKAKLVDQLKKQEIEEFSEFNMLLEAVNSEDDNFYEDVPDDGKEMYRSMLYVQALSYVLMNYCLIAEIKLKELKGESHKSEYHKVELKKLMVNAPDDVKKSIRSKYGNADSFIWEEFISYYDNNYDGLTTSQEEIDKMFGKGENKAPFLKVMDEVFDKAEKNGTLYQSGISIDDMEKLYMDASDKVLEEDDMTVEKFWGAKAI